MISQEPDGSGSWVKLYENFIRSGPGLVENQVGTFVRKGPGFQKLDLKINLKSFDINVVAGQVQIWAIYPNDPVASSSATGVSGFGSAYTDTMPWPAPPSDTMSYRAIDSKYRKIAEVNSGERLISYLDFPVKRIMLYVNLIK